MIRSILIAAAWLIAVPSALAQSEGPITDPEAFVRESYEALIEGGMPPEWGAPFYTERMLALFAENETLMQEDGYGRLDFGFWVNGQDWDITSVAVSSRDVIGTTDRRVVTAEFTNFGEPQRLVFYFERTDTGWRLDDVSSADWTLSLILKYG